MASPEISVLIPCLNEEAAVGDVVDEAWEGIHRSGRTGEVIVIDNASTDRSAEVAAEHGARVVREERRGYGSAYLAGLDHAAGSYLVMGDADNTYPLRDLGPFVDRLEQGDDLVLGSRFRGTIHGDAMPWLNRRIGNPILTGMLNVFFGVKVSDAHCGMRALRQRRGAAARPALDRDGVRLGDGLQGLPPRAARRRDPDRLLRPHRRLEAQPLRRRVAPRPLHAPLQPELALPAPGPRPAAARPRRDARARGRADGGPRPPLADPHDARARRRHADRRAARPALGVRAHVRGHAVRRPRPAAGALPPPRDARARRGRRRARVRSSRWPCSPGSSSPGRSTASASCGTSTRRRSRSRCSGSASSSSSARSSSGC